MKFERILTIIAIVTLVLSTTSLCMTADQAKEELMQGNDRFASGSAVSPNQSLERLEEVVPGQHPFAVVVTCSDSRLPPEIIFDQGVGDIFVIRTAGQVMDDVAIGSIEYAVEHLGVPLVVVMGHDSCGAVTAAISGEEAPGHIESIVEGIMPAIDEDVSAEDLLNSTIDANIRMQVESLKTSEPILAEMVEEGNLTILGARYHLRTGSVDLLE